jgi:hypothetical protein
MRDQIDLGRWRIIDFFNICRPRSAMTTSRVEADRSCITRFGQLCAHAGLYEAL